MTLFSSFSRGLFDLECLEERGLALETDTGKLVEETHGPGGMLLCVLLMLQRSEQGEA